MRRFLISVIIAFTSITSIMAQTTEAEASLKKLKTEIPEGWNKGGLFSLAFSQVSLTNWAAGGQNSISGNGLLSLFADYRMESLTWNNTFDIGYGLVKQGKTHTIKSDDKIDLVSKIGMNATKHWFYAGLINFRTQMTPGYNYPNDQDAISKFLAPAYFLAAIGMDYRGSESFSVFLAPLTVKMTIVNDDSLSNAGAFGVDAGSRFRSEFGSYAKVSYKKDLMENIAFQTKADFFSNYLHNPQNIDVNWETLLLMKVNKFITVSLATHLIYDDDIKILISEDETGRKEGPRTQFKEVFGVGLSYKF